MGCWSVLVAAAVGVGREAGAWMDVARAAAGIGARGWVGVEVVGEAEEEEDCQSWERGMLVGFEPSWEGVEGMEGER